MTRLFLVLLLIVVNDAVAFVVVRGVVSFVVVVDCVGWRCVLCFMVILVLIMI